ncbi:ABC transporter substrate-binding protein [Magnetovibrio sp.]|uniref:MlaC/ttg2D family ABC transporter substrate-binding protein n=1 Tax=Magnetovibrio sp. TaxID=2024836 RepID=UPI002F92AD05
MKQIVFAAIATVALTLSATSPTLSADYAPQYGSQYGQPYQPQRGPQYGAPYAPRYGSQFGQNYDPRFAPQPKPKPAAPQADGPSAKVAAQLSNLRTFLSQSQGGAAGANGTGLNPSQILSYVEKQIAPDIDFETMTQMALGRLGTRMSDQQRAAALSALRSNFTAKLVEAMGDIRATRFTVGKTRPGSSRGELVVPVRLDRWRGQPLTINFRFYKSKNGWKVFDAEAGGQSAVLFYRGFFARQWRQG